MPSTSSRALIGGDPLTHSTMGPNASAARSVQSFAPRKWGWSGPSLPPAASLQHARTRAPSRLGAEPCPRVLFTCQTAQFVPAARFLRPGFAFASRTRNEGWAEHRETYGRSCEAPVRRVSDTPGACEAPCVPCARDARLSALHRGDFGPGAALPSPDLRPDRSQRAPRTRVLVPGGRGPGPPEASGYQPAAAGRHSSLHLQEGALEDTPREQGCEFI